MLFIAITFLSYSYGAIFAIAISHTRSVPLLLVILASFIFYICEFSTYMAGGPWLTSRDQQSFARGLLASGSSINAYEPKILSLGCGDFWVAPNKISFCCKYHIAYVGCIPRWSPLHKQITQLYKQAQSA